MRRDLIIGILVSLLVHGGSAWVGEMAAHRPQAVKAKAQEPTIQLIEMPKLEPDEPEPTEDSQQQQTPVDFAPPMQTDVPSLVTDTSFVQKVEPPPPDTMSINKGAIVIPQNSGNWRAGIGQIFDVNKLDQIPIPIVQGRPQYPFEMRRAGISGTVTVDFIVDTAGNVRNPYPSSSSQREFESAAVQAVAKWRFRPGKKSGKAVNTHMLVPIVFTLNNED
jgi:protein TonB